MTRTLSLAFGIVMEKLMPIGTFILIVGGLAILYNWFPLLSILLYGAFPFILLIIAWLCSKD